MGYALIQLCLFVTAAFAGCGFMQVQCGSTCCDFMETCSGNSCCKFGESSCGSKCCPSGTICGDGQCVENTCENQHKYGCACDSEELHCKERGHLKSCSTSLFKCDITPTSQQVACRCHGSSFVDQTTASQAIEGRNQIQQQQQQQVNKQQQQQQVANTQQDQQEVLVPQASASHFFLYFLAFNALVLAAWAYHKGYFRIMLAKYCGGDKNYDSAPLNSRRSDMPAYQDYQDA
eukprot:gb/GEZN01002129.1/.p2 GENE.gb/GEZN01002129.1/~~gb/GEZN01002129.1/.p2  ORF type:complete len:233 (+),score=46.36 gb/GEZN01002129.1/:1461-2159(+)